MDYLSRLVALALVALTISAVHTVAKDAPSSPDELAKRLEQALKAKNQSAALELFCWDGVSKDMKTKQEAPMHMLFDEMGQGLDLSSVTVGSLPPDFPVEQVLNGVKYRPNLPVLGAIHVTLAEDFNPTIFIFVYGKKDDTFYLSALAEAKASGKTDDKK
jgi:hypothetical protein